MTQLIQHTSIEQVLELLSEQGTEGFLEAMRILFDAAMLFERERFLNAAAYECTPDRRDADPRLNEIGNGSIGISSLHCRSFDIVCITIVFGQGKHSTNVTNSFSVVYKYLFRM